MFKRAGNQTGKEITFTFEGQELRALEAENLAAAMLVAGVKSFRSIPVSGSARAPFCMMGSCFECLVEIDGVSTQACMTTVRQDMQVKRLPILTEREQSQDG